MAQKFFDIRPFQCQRFAIVPIFAELVDPDSVGFFRPGRIMSKAHAFVQFIEYFFPAGQMASVIRPRGL